MPWWGWVLTLWLGTTIGLAALFALVAAAQTLMSLARRRFTAASMRTSPAQQVIDVRDATDEVDVTGDVSVPTERRRERRSAS